MLPTSLRVLRLAACLLLTLLLASCGLKPASSPVPAAEPGSIQPIAGAQGQKITVGSKNFTEQLILGKIAVLTADVAGFDVVDMTNIPGSQPARKVLVQGEVDLEWEYTGTAWLVYLGQSQSIADPAAMWQAVSAADQKNGLTWGAPSKLNNTYAFAVRSDYAKERGISKLSDLAELPVQERTLCIEAEFNSRADGLNGMLQTYGLQRGSSQGVPDSQISIMDTGTVYSATAQGSCNFGEVFTTDGRIKALDLTVLEDDLSYFPAYSAAPVFASKTLERYPQLQDIFDQVARRLDDTTMRDLNYKVDVQGQDPAQVAYDWMIEQGLIR